MNQKELTTLEILGIAIQSEIESARYYRMIKHNVYSPSLREKLTFLIGEEGKHLKILMDIYKQKFPGIKLVRPKTSLVPKPKINDKGKTTISMLLNSAMKAEQNSEKFYNRMAPQIGDIQGVLLLDYLAKSESSHYYIIKNELELIDHGKEIRQMRLLYQEDEAVHLGP